MVQLKFIDDEFDDMFLALISTALISTSGKILNWVSFGSMLASLFSFYRLDDVRPWCCVIISGDHTMIYPDNPQYQYIMMYEANAVNI